MKIIPLALFIGILSVACKTSPDLTSKDTPVTSQLKLDDEQVLRLSQLPLRCIRQPYPNKPGFVLADSSDLAEPQQLHPAFYGCFDWHSSVHGHWVLVYLLKHYPDMPNAADLKQVLQQQLTKENIAAEVAYFNRATETSFERTYGWAWLLKLAEELYTWDNAMAGELFQNLEPLANLIVSRYIDYLPRLVYPIRTGEHPNTAFGLTFAWDFAIATQQQPLMEMIRQTALRFFANDKGCPIEWEPGGHDFLSPCLEEVDIMRRILAPDHFDNWLAEFMPQLSMPDFTLEPGIVVDRTDGKLVHLDGLNFSRAWCLLGLANQSDRYVHLRKIAEQHIDASLPQIVDGSYEGEHWLASFALYALSQQVEVK